MPLTASCFAPTARSGLTLSLPRSDLAPCSRAMIWYVNSTTGSDANDGRTPQTAFKMLARAVDAAKAGDTVLLAPGAYDQNLPVLVSRARAANITVSVAGSE
jgi:uncharacterized protein DUF1565